MSRRSPGSGGILIRLPNWVGDMMMALPAIGALRAAYPDHRLVGMARPRHVELARRIFVLDEVIEAPPRQGGDRAVAAWRGIRGLRKADLGTAILLAPSFEAALTAWLAGIPIRIGHDTDHRRALLTRAIAETDGHRADGFVDLVRELDVMAPIEAGAALVLTAADHASVDRLVPPAVADGDARPVFVNPAAAKPPRAWSSDRFRRLTEALVERYPDVPVVVHDHPPFEHGADWPAAPSVRLLGDASLTQLAAVIDRCSLYVGNDSGPMHMAAALGVPTVGIYGSSSPARTSPRGAPHTVVSADFECSPCRERFFEECPAPPTADQRPPCLDAVTVEMVLSAVERARGRPASAG